MESGIDPGQDYYAQDYYSYEPGFVSRLTQSLNITAAPAGKQRADISPDLLTSSDPCRPTPSQI